MARAVLNDATGQIIEMLGFEMEIFKKVVTSFEPSNIIRYKVYNELRVNS